MRGLKTGERDYTLSEQEREDILSRAARIYRKGITMRFTKWFFYLLAFFAGIFPHFSWNVGGTVNYLRLTIGLCIFTFIAVWQAVRLIKAFGIKRKLNALDDSTLAVVFREVKNPTETKGERWKSYFISTLLLFIATVGLDFISFGALMPFFEGKGLEAVYLLLGASKLCIVIERFYEEKTQADFYITSCHLF